MLKPGTGSGFLHVPTLRAASVKMPTVSGKGIGFGLQSPGGEKEKKGRV